MLLLDIGQICEKVEALRQVNVARDQRMMDMMSVRSGEVERAFPEHFSEHFPKPIIANFIDVAAKDVSETLAPLPAFNCSATNMVSDAARKAADKRTKGANYYLAHSDVQTQMYRGADWYSSFALMPICIEPDWDAQCPRWCFETPMGGYAEWDRWGRTKSFTRRFKRRIIELCAEWPEYATLIAGKEGTGSAAMLELILYRDADQTVLYIPERGDAVLSRYAQPLGECPVICARRPSVDDSTHGQFDDVLWVQLARHRFAMLSMEAAEESVEAPLALPLDVQEIPIGPRTTMRSNSPEKIRRVGLDMPQGAFLEAQALDAELRTGARYPGTRTGQSPASSIVTGNAISQLEGGFDSQIKAAQDVFKSAFTEAMRLSFKMDELYWPNVEKSIRGNADGVPYEIKWKPSRDINGDHSIDVVYGFASGIGDPNRALVFLLQLLGGRLVSKDMVRRQFPFGVDVTMEEQRIEIEDLRDSLVQSVAAYAQSIPVLAQQGMDPSEPLMRITEIIKGRQKGKSLEDVISESFAPKPPPGLDAAAAAGLGGAGETSPGGQIPLGMKPSGLPAGVAPGQAQMGPGGQPDLMTMLAGLNSAGGPTTNVNVKRAVPA